MLGEHTSSLQDFTGALRAIGQGKRHNLLVLGEFDLGNTLDHYALPGIRF